MLLLFMVTQTKVKLLFAAATITATSITAITAAAAAENNAAGLEWS